MLTTGFRLPDWWMAGGRLAGWRSANWRLVGLLALAAALPVLLVPITGMVDLPNHIARFRVFQAAGSGGPLDQLFFVHWRWIANLGVDLPVQLLAPLIGVEAASRLVVAAIAPLTVVGAVALARAAHRRLPTSAFVALPLAFSHPWYYGFVNYCLSVALALLVTAAWYARPPGRLLPALGFGLSALLVWTAHLGGWVVLLLLIAGAELVGLAALPRRRRLAALARRLAVASPLLLPLLPLLAWRSAGGGRLFSYGEAPLVQKALAFVTILNGLSRSFDVASAVVLLGLGALALGWAAGGASSRGWRPAPHW